MNKTKMTDLCLVMLPNPALSNPKMYYSLGILYLASVSKKAGYNTIVHDCRDGYHPFPEAKYYGFSATTPEFPYARKLSKGLKGKTIIGGAHASLLPKDCLDEFDYVVVGEGEEVLLDILGGKMRYPIVTGKRIYNLDDIPFPAWDMIDNPFSETLFPGEKYGQGESAATIIASRGCPHKCSFCANIYHAPIRFRGVDNIVSEIMEIKKRGIRYFRFEDDNLTIHPRFKELVEKLKEADIVYKCHVRSDYLTDDKARMLRESGCEECGLGVESADDAVLKLNEKHETAIDHAQAIKILKDNGIRAKTYWVMGLPGETDRTLMLNEQFVVNCQPDRWTISTFTPYPGCAIFKNPAQFGIEIIDWDYAHWWNFCEESQRYNHLIIGQTMDEMWDRYKEFYKFMKERSDVLV